jgi:transposase
MTVNSCCYCKEAMAQKKTQPPAQTPASWRLRSRSEARTVRRPNHARSEKHACRSICPPWTRSSSLKKSVQSLKLGGRIGEEVTEQLDYQPARFLRRRIIRRKYVKRNEPHKAPIIAPLNTLQERSIAAPGLLAQIIVAKYCDHLPLYRQEQIYATRHDIAIPRQSMARWLRLAADWLRPIYDHIHTGVMAGGYVQIDEPSGAR